MSDERALAGLSRRTFLCASGTAALVLALPAAAAARLRENDERIRIGLIADLHQDLVPDGEARIDAFAKRMAELEADAVLQLGDFAYPNEKNHAVIERFNRATKVPLHVIGNHDLDAGHTREECREVWGLRGRFYARDVRGVRVLVLDGNDAGSPVQRGGYAAWIGPEQREWLAGELAAHAGPFLVASHQPLAGTGAVDEAEALQAILSRFAEKIALVVNGHTHVDQLLRVGGVNYLHVNSASYYWVGGAHQHESYPTEIHTKYPWLGHTCPYRDPVFSALGFEPSTGTVTIEGRQSAWVGPSPAELGVDAPGELIHGEQIAPRTRSRRIERARRRVTGEAR